MRICPKCNTRMSDDVCPFDGRKTVEEEAGAPPADPMIGQVIGDKYRLQIKLGGGGFGSVYRGEHTQTGGAVAVKLLAADMENDPLAAKRFAIEARNTHKLHHHNTVRVSDFGRSDGGMLFLVMEFLEGESLDKILRRDVRLPAERAVRITEQILKSLTEAHSHNIVHRDIKPANVMLVDAAFEPDFVKVLDFGVSRALDGPGADTQGSIGTPRYMSPEQCKGETVDPRADLYAVGCLLYRMLAGRTPFAFDKGRGQTLAYIHAHIAEPPPDLLHVAPAVCSRPLADLVMSLLRKEPKARPASAEAVLLTLQRLRQTPTGLQGAEAPSPLPAGWNTGTTGAVGSDPAGSTQALGSVGLGDDADEPPSRVGVYIGLGLLALVAAAGAVYWVVSQ